MTQLFRDGRELFLQQKGYKKFLYTIFIGMVILLTLLLTLTTFEYIDCMSLTVWSVNFWDVLSQGQLSEYYTYLLTNMRGAAQTWGFGSWLMILPWALWNFPLWLTHPMNGNYIVTDPFSIYWSKLFLFFMLFIAAFYLYKIVKRLTNDAKTAIIAFLFMIISPEVLMSVGVAGQDEIVYMTFFLIAVNYWLENRKLLFLFWSICSVICCPIILLFYLLLVVIDEKNLIKIAGYLVLPMLPTLIFDFLYKNDSNYTTWKASTEEMITNIFGYTSVTTAIGTVSIAAILLIIVYVYYYFKSDSVTDRSQNAIYGLALIGVIFCIGMNYFYYRAFIYIPFLILLCTVSRKEIIKTNITFLAVLSGISSFVTLGMNEPLNMNTMYTTQNRLIMKICEMTGSDRYTNFSSVHSKLLERYPVIIGMLGIVSAVAIVIILLLLWLNRPKAKEVIRFEVSYRYSYLIYASVMPMYLAIFYILLFLYL